MNNTNSIFIKKLLNGKWLPFERDNDIFIRKAVNDRFIWIYSYIINDELFYPIYWLTTKSCLCVREKDLQILKNLDNVEEIAQKISENFDLLFDKVVESDKSDFINTALFLQTNFDGNFNTYDMENNDRTIISKKDLVKLYNLNVKKCIKFKNKSPLIYVSTPLGNVKDFHDIFNSLSYLSVSNMLSSIPIEYQPFPQNLIERNSAKKEDAVLLYPEFEKKELKTLDPFIVQKEMKMLIQQKINPLIEMEKFASYANTKYFEIGQLNIQLDKQSKSLDSLISILYQCHLYSNIFDIIILPHKINFGNFVNRMNFNVEINKILTKKTRQILSWNNINCKFLDFEFILGEKNNFYSISNKLKYYQIPSLHNISYGSFSRLDIEITIIIKNIFRKFVDKDFYSDLLKLRKKLEDKINNLRKKKNIEWLENHSDDLTRHKFASDMFIYTALQVQKLKQEEQEEASLNLPIENPEFPIINAYGWKFENLHLPDNIDKREEIEAYCHQFQIYSDETKYKPKNFWIYEN